MNVAFVLALFGATVTLGTAVVHFAISRAPGWRASRTFAAIALTGTMYSLGNLVFASPDTAESVHRLAIRANYLCANLHAVLWLPWLIGGAEARWREVPKPYRWLAVASVSLAAFFAITGLHLDVGEFAVPIAWAGVTYHYAHTTLLGEAYGYFLVAQILLAFALLLVRIARGERGLVPIAVGFVVYLACAVVEALVANGVVATLSPADIGFLAVIVPTSWVQAQRFVGDAQRLRDLSGQLAGEVRARTAERDRAESALRESERLAALGRLAAGVGHEINNPLTYMQGALDRVASHVGTAGAPLALREAVADARDGAWRIEKVVEGLRTYSRRHADRTPLDLRDVARAALKVAQPSIRHAASLELRLDEAPPALGDEPGLVQALVNLLTNAAQAVVEGGGRVCVRTGVTGTGEPYLEVEDDGPGIATEHLARIGEPYFTTRSARGGLGLGLFTTRGIVDAHGGRLEISASAPRGTRARIVLPRAAVELAPVPAAPRARELAAPRDFSRRSRLLVVDDEPRVLRLLATLLGDEWDVAQAQSAEAAYALIDSGAFDVLLCDLMLAGTSGVQLATEIAARDPGLRARMVFMTGGAITPEAESFLARPDVAFVTKPMDFDALRQLLRAREGAAA
jgi:signal transduction histidine kinase/CheY-like chemotaxis protein